MLESASFSWKSGIGGAGNNLILWNSPCILLYGDLLQRIELFTIKIVWRINSYSSIDKSACCRNLAFTVQSLEPMGKADVVAFICNLSTSQ